MALTPLQLDSLLDANPFVPSDWYDYVHDEIVRLGNVDNLTAYAYLLVGAQNFLVYLQYLLDTPDEILENPLVKLSGQIRPLANVVTTLEEATTGKVNLIQLVFTNTGPTTDTIALHHVKALAEAAPVNLILSFTLNPGTDNAYTQDFNLPISVGEKIQVISSSGTTSITAYIDG